MGKFHFTFKKIKEQYQAALNKGYSFITCEEYVLNKDALVNKTIINRVDVDISVKKAEQLGIIFNELGIKASFFIRLHAPEYNPFSFENYRVIKFLIESGHEIGYHSEIIDQSVIWNEDVKENLIRDIDVINRIFNINIKGIASHGGMTGLNNLDFWKNNKASDFGLLYEAYDWFDKAYYISDSEWTQWKVYNNGKLVERDKRSFKEHVEQENYELIYLLIHSDTYFEKHFYE